MFNVIQLLLWLYSYMLKMYLKLKYIKSHIWNRQNNFTFRAAPWKSTSWINSRLTFFKSSTRAFLFCFGGFLSVKLRDNNRIKQIEACIKCTGIIFLDNLGASNPNFSQGTDVATANPGLLADSAVSSTAGELLHGVLGFYSWILSRTHTVIHYDYVGISCFPIIDDKERH